MARPSRFVHPFRRVRDIIGISQERAAVALGISTSTLQQIERGILPLSEDISKRMEALTGVKIPAGVCNKTVAPIAWDDSPYDENTLERYRKYADPEHKSLAGVTVEVLEFLLKQAVRKKRLGPVLVALNKILGELIPAFDLWSEDDSVDYEEELRFLRMTKDEFVRMKTQPGSLEDLPKITKKSAESAQKPPKSVQEELLSNPEAFVKAVRRLTAESSKSPHTSNLKIGDFVGETQEQSPKKAPRPKKSVKS